MINNCVADKALQWIKNNTIDGHGITITSKQKRVYPEVTGYYIPTLLNIGEENLAIAYAKYLCNIQKENGAWYDAYDNYPYVFDSAQILKGLVAIEKKLPNVKYNIEKGCDWLLSNMDESGRLKPAISDCFAEDTTVYSELIHLYCLTPLIDAGKLLNKPEYAVAVEKIKRYYLENYKHDILNFSLLSHFYAYVMEGLVDLGEKEIIRTAMNNIEKYKDENGAIPGLYDVKWVCSTGLFQLAIVWYKLNEVEKGNRLFEYACSLQNSSGGWFGSYSISFANKYFTRKRKKAWYFPKEEIAWANKYYFDALLLHDKLNK